MFAPVILPFQITAAIFIVAVVVMCLLFRRRKPIAIAVATAGLLFIPSCAGIDLLVDAVRYGQFSYATAAQLNDPYVQIPESSTSISLHKYASGHEVRFAVSEEELQIWMAAVVAQRKQFAEVTPFELDESVSNKKLRQTDWENDFGRNRWSCPDDIVRYKGGRSGRGGGFDVWYSASSQTGFIAAAYW